MQAAGTTFAQRVRVAIHDKRLQAALDRMMRKLLVQLPPAG